MNRVVRTHLFAPVLAGILLAASGQSIADYKISDYTFNSGGHPHQGTVMWSGSYRVTLDALGDGVTAIGLNSASFHMGGGFPACYPPPGEVRGLTFTDKQTLEWMADQSVGGYNLYRDSIGVLSGLGYGACLQENLPDTTTIDADTPPTTDGYFYLVTAENRLDEEGPKGIASDGAEREGSVCP